MSDTNDEQAPYGEKREPMLSYSDFSALLDEEAEDLGVDDETHEGRCEWNAMNAAGNAIREFYENLIDKGELRVNKKVTVMRMGAHSFCSDCGTCTDPHPDFANRPPNPLCPGCGGEIQK